MAGGRVLVLFCFVCVCVCVVFWVWLIDPASWCLLASFVFYHEVRPVDFCDRMGIMAGIVFSSG